MLIINQSLNGSDKVVRKTALGRVLGIKSGRPVLSNLKVVAIDPEFKRLVLGEQSDELPEETKLHASIPGIVS